MKTVRFFVSAQFILTRNPKLLAKQMQTIIFALYNTFGLWHLFCTKATIRIKKPN